METSASFEARSAPLPYPTPRRKLDLFEFATRQVAQSGAGASEIVRRENLNSSVDRDNLDDVPDRLRRDRLTPHSPEPAYASEDRNRADTRDCRPIANHPLRPDRDRNSPDMFSLADQVGDDPMSFRICRSSILRPTSSARRSPQPIRNARIARSRLPRVVSYGKPCSNVLD